ncbi:helix-turn-helix domain-containing protein [Flindersiella endophytica]
MRDGFLADCPARVAVDLLSHTWNLVVLQALSRGPRRPSELQRTIGGIRQKVLTQTLHRLQDNGLVRRRSYREAPPRVEYDLTELGRSLLDAFEPLAAWSHQHADDVLDAQDRATPQP